MSQNADATLVSNILDPSVKTVFPSEGEKVFKLRFTSACESLSAEGINQLQI